MDGDHEGPVIELGFGTGSVKGPFYKMGFTGDGSRHSVFFSSLEARVEKTKLQNLFFQLGNYI